MLTIIRNSTACKSTLLTHLNPQLKQLINENDFKEAPPFLFGENFEGLAKDHLEAAAAPKELNQSLLVRDNRVFKTTTFRKTGIMESGNQFSHSGRGHGWKLSSNKTNKTQSKMTITGISCTTTANSIMCTKFIKCCYTYAGNKHTDLSFTGTYKHYEPVNKLPKNGRASGLLFTKLGSVNPGPMGPLSCGLLPAKLTGSPISTTGHIR